MKGRRSGEPFSTRLVTTPVFIEAPGFAEDWSGLGYDDDDVMHLQSFVIAWPKSGSVVPGTGGLRKLRFASPRKRQGKRGATRVGYVFFEDYALVLLVLAYAKTSQRDILAQQKKSIRQMIASYVERLKQHKRT